MKSKLNKIFVTAIIAMMTLAVLPAFVKAKPADSFWIEPENLNFDTNTASPGDTFVVTIWTNVTFPAYTWQVKIWYDTNHLTALRADYTGVGKSEFFDGLPTVPVTPIIDDGEGSVLHGESLMGENSATGVGTLFWIEFEIDQAPPKGGSLESMLTFDQADTYWLDSDLNEQPTDKYPAYFTYTWIAPPPPHLAVEPGFLEFGPYPPSAIGEEFDVDIVIKSLDVNWGLHNVSLSLSFNSTLLEVLAVTPNPIWGTFTWTDYDGTIDMFAEDPSTTPSGDVVIATVRFNITFQDTVPPRLPGDYDETALDIHDYELWDTSIQIPTDPEEDGLVRINCLISLVIAHLEVSDATMGPEPARGEEFNVTVSIKNLDYHWFMIGVEFRLAYDPTLIEPVAVHEGPFLPYYAAMHNGSLGTFFIYYFETDGVYGPHVLVGNMILPNASGLWSPVEEEYPDDEGVIAIITFRVLYQSFGEPDLTCGLDIVGQLAIGLDDPDPAKQNIVGIPLDPPVNGVYTITTDWPGRMIDVFGGAENRGYGSIPFPAPFGGQGPNNPMDLVIPQSRVFLFAEVTYNYWPVQSKDVGFEVEGPFNHTTGEPKPAYWVRKFAARTDENGIAAIDFQMPWPCDNPEDLFGLYKVTATVDIGGVIVNDTLEFNYYYLVEITKVTTDKFEYDHRECVKVTIEYRTKAQQEYPALITVVIVDELGVPIAMAEIETTVGGAQFCSWAEFTDTVTICIPKWAFAGIATILVTAFDMNPTLGGAPWAPTYGDGWPIGAEPPTIAIQPY